MSCERFGTAIAAHAAGAAIDPATARHLSGCAACRRLLDTQAQMLAELDAELGRSLSLTASPDFVARVARAARDIERGTRTAMDSRAGLGGAGNGGRDRAGGVGRSAASDRLAPPADVGRRAAAPARTEDFRLKAEATQTQEKLTHLAREGSRRRERLPPLIAWLPASAGRLRPAVARLPRASVREQSTEAPGAAGRAQCPGPARHRRASAGAGHRAAARADDPGPPQRKDAAASGNAGSGARGTDHRAARNCRNQGARRGNRRPSARRSAAAVKGAVSMKTRFAAGLALLAALLAPPLVAQEPTPPPPPPGSQPRRRRKTPAPIPLKVTVVLSRFQGESASAACRTCSASWPAAGGRDRRPRCAWALNVPVDADRLRWRRAGTKSVPMSSYTYRGVGTNIDCGATFDEAVPGIFQLALTVSDSSLGLDTARSGTASCRTCRRSATSTRRSPRCCATARRCSTPRRPIRCRRGDED